MTITLELTDKQVNLARRIAAARGETFEEFVITAIGFGLDCLEMPDLPKEDSNLSLDDVGVSG